MYLNDAAQIAYGHKIEPSEDEIMRKERELIEDDLSSLTDVDISEAITEQADRIAEFVHANRDDFTEIGRVTWELVKSYRKANYVDRDLDDWRDDYANKVRMTIAENMRDE